MNQRNGGPGDGPGEKDKVNCSNCGNDLLVEVAPTGAGKLLRLLSVASYTCVRCGKTTTVATSKARVALVCLLVAAVLGLAALFAMDHALRDTRNSVRRTVDTTSAPLPPVATPDAQVAAPTPPPTALPDPGADQGATPAPEAPRAQAPAATGEAASAAPDQPAPAPGGDNAAASPAASPPGTDTVAPAEVTAEGVQAAPATSGGATASPAASASAAQPDTGEENTATSTKATQAAPRAQASDAPQPPAAPGATPRPPQEAPLEEVVVAAPPSPVRPGGTGTASAPAGTTGWSATLSGVRSGLWNGALVVHLDTSGTMGAPKGFALASPPRYVVDVPGSWSYAGEHSVAIDKATATTLRLGLHEDKLRVVLDLTRAPKNASVRRTAQGLTITLR